MDQQAEIITNSIVPEGAPAPIEPLTPEQQRIKTLGSMLRTRYAEVKDTDPTAALRRPEGNTSLANVDVSAEITRRVRKAEAGEPDTRAELTALANDLKLVAEKGLAGLVDASGDKQKAFIKKYVESVLESREAFMSLTPEQRDAIAKGFFEDPSQRAILAKHIAETLSPNEVTETEDDRELERLIKEREEAEKLKKAAKKAIGKAETERESLIDTKNKHQEVDPTTGEEGVSHKKIRDLSEGLASTTDIAKANITLRDAFINNEQAINNIRNIVITKMKSGITNFTDQYEASMYTIIKNENSLSEINKLRTEAEGIDDRIKQQDKTLKKLQKERTKIKQTLSENEDESDETERNLDKREKALKQKLESIISNAGNEQMDEQITKRFDTYRGILEKEAEEANDADKKKLLEARTTRWHTVEVKNGHARPRFREATSLVDLRAVLTSGGDISSMIGAMLKYDLAPSPTDTQEALIKKQAEIIRIDKKIKEDPEFVKNASQEFVQDLLVNRFMAGKKLFRGEQELINKYGWGGILNNAVNNNEQSQGALAEMIAKNGEPGKLEQLKREYGDDWGSILGILLAGIVLPSAVVSKIAGQEIGR